MPLQVSLPTTVTLASARKDLSNPDEVDAIGSPVSGVSETADTLDTSPTSGYATVMRCPFRRVRSHTGSCGYLVALARLGFAKPWGCPRAKDAL